MSAVLLDVTISGALTDGHVTAYPCGYQRPTSSMLNVGRGDASSASALVPVGDHGLVCLYITSGGAIVVDRLGSFSVDGDGSAWSRGSIEVAETVLAAAKDLSFVLPDTLGGISGLLADTTISSLDPGYLSLCDQPEVSVVDFAPGSQVRQIALPVREGRICLWSSVEVQIRLSTSVWFGGEQAGTMRATRPRRHDGRDFGPGGIKWTTEAEHDEVLLGTFTFINDSAAPANIYLEEDCANVNRRAVMTAAADTVTAAFVGFLLPAGSTVCLSPDASGTSLFDYQAHATP